MVAEAIDLESAILALTPGYWPNRVRSILAQHGLKIRLQGVERCGVETRMSRYCPAGLGFLRISISPDVIGGSLDCILVR
jgi:hypothetical protein